MRTGHQRYRLVRQLTHQSGRFMTVPAARCNLGPISAYRPRQATTHSLTRQTTHFSLLAGMTQWGIVNCSMARPIRAVCPVTFALISVVSAPWEPHRPNWVPDCTKTVQSTTSQYPWSDFYLFIHLFTDYSYKMQTFHENLQHVRGSNVNVHHQLKAKLTKHIT